MTTAPEQFRGLPFVAGSVQGIRSWDVDDLGRLVSPSYRTVWTPSENVAECKKRSGAVGWAGGGVTLTWTLNPTSGGSGAVLRQEEPEASKDEAAEEAPHTQESCHCGFYAYSNGLNDYADPWRITGVIEGYGETQLGTRGFKSAKARIRALHVPKPKRTKPRRREVTPPAAVGDRLRVLYGQAGIAIFEDYAEMLAEFPTYQHEATPDADPDFWTRGVFA